MQVHPQAGGETGASPAAGLSLSEQALFGSLRFPRRRASWLAGRLAAKALLRAAAPELAQVESVEIEILNEPGGAPYVMAGGARTGWSISLSHSHGWALCAAARTDCKLGVDLEWIEARPASFSEDFFTEREAALVQAAGENQRSLLETLVWSSKEAVLKARATGLRVDTRTVEVVLPRPFIEMMEWSPLEWHTSLPGKGPLRLYWRLEAGFVLTVCLPQGVSGLVQVLLPGG